jgi:hypothetical protein
MTIEVTIPRAPAERQAALAELRGGLSERSSDSRAEVWVHHDPFPSLCALINGSRGWLMCIRRDGDAGFSSRNPGYSGPSDAEVEYTLSNGQVDRYPASWAYPTAEVLRALEFFAETGRVPETLSWWNDSGDGMVSPNAPADRQGPCR